KHLLEIPGDRDFLHRTSQFAMLNPEPACAARVIPGDTVDAKANEFGYVKTVRHRTNDFLGRIPARFEVEIGRTNTWRFADSARSITGRRELKFARRVSVEQIRCEDAFFDQALTICRQSLAIERLGAHPGAYRTIVVDRNSGRGDLRAELPDQKGSTLIK